VQIALWTKIERFFYNAFFLPLHGRIAIRPSTLRLTEIHELAGGAYASTEAAAYALDVADHTFICAAHIGTKSGQTRHGAAATSLASRLLHNI